MDEFDLAAQRVRLAAESVGWTQGTNWGRSCLMFTLPNKHTLMAEMYDCGHRPEWASDIEVGEYDEDGEHNGRAWLLRYSPNAEQYILAANGDAHLPSPALLDFVNALNRSRA